MKISAKGRYALAAVISMAQQHHVGEYITVISISEKLGISKIYLEQVFSLLKRAELVVSVKGSQGGYLLAHAPEQITVLDILSAVESTMFERAQDTVPQKSPQIDKALRSAVFEPLDNSIEKTLSKVSLDNLVDEVEKFTGEDANMFYI